MQDDLVTETGIRDGLDGPGRSPEDASSQAPASGPDPDLADGTYELLRDRLANAAADLADRACTLNARRVETFGGTELALLGTDGLRTADACVIRDVAQVGGLLLTGRNGRPEPGAPATAVTDVFALHRLHTTGDAVRLEPAEPGAVPGLLDDPRFQRDFEELYRYYRQARLLRLHRTGALLLAVFRTGERLDDIRVLRWKITASGDAAEPGTPVYLDAKGERDHTAPPSHDFTWTPATREDHVAGRYPQLSVQGEVFLSTAGGSLTLKTEPDTETADGLYSEPVDEPLQSLADAEVAYARVGPLVLLRVRPYKETADRYLVFNTRTHDVRRIDAIGQACRALPEDQGIVFPGGHYLTTGTARTFDTDTTGLAFDREHRSPNGEDVLYAFHDRAEGRTLLLPYNIVREEAATPLTAYGHALLGDGTLAVLRGSREPGRVHPVQIWRTPFTSDAHAAAQPAGDGGPLARIGNAELVRGVSDALSVARMATDMAPAGPVFEAIAAAAARVADRHHWLDEAGLGALGEPLEAVRAAALQVVEEFARVTELRRQAAAALEEAADRTTALIRRIRGEQPTTAEAWVRNLTALRHAQGRLETLRETRHIDLDRLAELSASVTDSLAAAGRRAIAFLSGPDAFTATHRAVEALTEEAAAVTTAADAEPLAARIDEQAEGLRVVTEVVGTLDVADTTVRTAVLTRAGEVLGAVNRARATLDARRRDLLEAEGREEFAARFALLGQAVSGALAAAGTPEECDDELGRLLLQLENLEARFGTSDTHLERIAAQREEIHEAFSARKQAQLDARARHTDRLAGSAGRVLATVVRRAATLTTPDEINAFFAADPLVTKIHATTGELRDLGDGVRADELDGRLRAARQEAARALRDRTDLYDATGTIRLGRYRFAVNTQPVDLTLVPHGDHLAYAVTGTDYRAPVHDAVLLAHRAFWDQPLVSESPEVYRAEHLAALILAQAEEGAGVRNADAPVPDLAALQEAATTDTLLPLVRRTAEARYDEGYDRGVHDHDAAAILAVLLRLHTAAGPLRYPPHLRAAAQLFWAYGTDDRARALWTTRACSLARARSVFGTPTGWSELSAELGGAAYGFLREAGVGLAGEAGDPSSPLGDYLMAELTALAEPTALGGPAAAGRPRFATSAAARDLLAGFQDALGGPDAPAVKELAEDLRALDGDLAARHQLVTGWLGAYAQARGTATGALPQAESAADTSVADATAADATAADALPEAVAIEVCGPALDRRELSAPTGDAVRGLLGSHPRIAAGGTLPVRLDELLARTETFRRTRVPAHRAYTRRRTELLTAERDRLRLDTYRPQVMSGFVRNRLIDEVYLPLIGDNFAKQLGAAGERRRTDSQGLLLLLSPPGYGKTTLMEYVAARLGLLLVKVDGPALGHRTTSLDPAAAPDAAARREVEKISFALEAGSNVLLYLDDIQHTSPELLQKFIPLCDAQRRMDGVRDGEARTYDLRGKRFAVCMAGNPYTEAGQRFRLPDMLANRADVWNLGDVLSGKEALFAHSHIENALPANPVLAPLAARDRADLGLLVRMAEGDDSVRADRLAHPYGTAELREVVSVLRGLLQVREAALTVNRAYIASAAQADATRTEPPFLLQGSYRNTGKMAARIVPVMNDTELASLIDDHYRGEAQTLTTGAEANLLKLAELRGRLTPEQARRWAEVKEMWRSRADREGAGAVA
ncbi:DNA repair ATPase [Streptomyces chrestomyceticus]|uniref:DNA repair ATPase n=1 Tax=Streptomyces chrestomyceticus TaxID=68185 RepID=UPI0035582C76